MSMNADDWFEINFTQEWIFHECVGASQDFKILADSVAKQNKASNKPN